MATRDLTTALTNALDDQVVKPFFAVELLFDTAPIRIWTGTVDATIDGDTYIGAGNLLNIDTIEETSEIAVRGAKIVLSGMDSNVISLALQSTYQGRVCNIYFGVVDGTTYTNLTQLFSGYMDEMNITEGPDYGVVELLVENKLIDLERKRTRRFSSGYQKSQYPGDRGFDFVEDLQDKDIVFIVNCYKQIEPLAKLEWEESGHPTEPLEIDWDTYFNLEGSGALKLYTCRQEDLLVGYFTVLLIRPLTMKNTPTAVLDAVYISKDHRGIGRRMFQFVEQSLKEEGYNRVLASSSVKNPIDDFLLRMGYTETETKYEKVI